MSGNSDSVRFDMPQPMSRTSARLGNEESGDVFDVIFTGPQEMLESFVDEGVPLRIEWEPQEVSEKLQESSRQAHDDKQGAMLSPEEQEKEFPPSYPIRGMDIQIRPSQPWPEGHNLRVELDPDIGHKESHYFCVNGASEAWAKCEVIGGDADLYLYEILANGEWATRDTSLHWGTQTDEVDASKQATGNWSLRVYGFNASTYELSGLFKP